MTGPDTPPIQPNEAMIAGALTSMQIVAEAVVGYHRKLVEGNVPLESAGRMAEEFHSVLMAQLAKAKAQPQGTIKRRDNR